MALLCFVKNFWGHDLINCRFDQVSFDQLSGHDLTFACIIFYPTSGLQLRLIIELRSGSKVKFLGVEILYMIMFYCALFLVEDDIYVFVGACFSLFIYLNYLDKIEFFQHMQHNANQKQV